jgi:hypothetical protein
MPQPTHAERLEDLERHMTDQTFQFSQFRDEVRMEFSAVRAEFAAVREEMRQQFAAAAGETRRLITESETETRHLMRMLHEDIIARFAALEDRWNGRTLSLSETKRGRRRKS